MKRLLLTFVTAAALAAAGTAEAAPGLSLRGDTGLARTPMVAAQAPMSLAFAADYVSSNEKFIPMRAEFGVIQGLEVGGNWWYMDLPGDTTAWGLNAKYVLPEFVPNLGLAVGGHYRKQTISDVENDGHDLYFAVAYPVGFVVPTAGVIYEAITGDNDETDVRFFGSLVANVVPELAVGAEIMSASDKLDGDNADPAMWFGARFAPTPALSVQVGMLNYADIGAGLQDQKDFILHVGVQYGFSFGK
jgi:hypothetical protein